MSSHRAALNLSLLCRYAAVAGLGCLITACSSAPGQQGLTTASLQSPPIGTVGQKQQAAYPPQRAVHGTAKAHSYQWSGNRDRMQAGAARSPVPASNVQSPHAQWKASPRAPETGVMRPVERTAYPPQSLNREIIVMPGDTLYSLANKHQVGMTSLMQVNQLHSPEIKVSQRLVLPAASR